jgi:hypothetical protein
MTKRTREFQRNQELELLLERLGDILSEAELKAVSNFKKPDLPVILVHGCARSGTTLMMQVLADTQLFAYPSNFISRFYKAPYIGALIQLMLTDKKYCFRNEFSELDSAAINYDSSLGKTKGILSPNEFNYFWRRFFNLEDPPRNSSTSLPDDVREKLLCELASLEIALGKALVIKGLVMNWHISYLASIIDSAVFIYVKRDELFNAQSLLEAREKYYGDINEWYSLKPPEYAYLADKDPVTQVIGQVIYTNDAIERGLENISEDRKLSIDYQYLCTSPNEVVSNLLTLLNKKGYELKVAGKKRIMVNLVDRNMQRVDNGTWKNMEDIRDSIKSSLYKRK